MTAAEILNFSQNADDLPLRIGAVLGFPSVAVTLPEAPVLGAVATAQSTTAGWLATDNLELTAGLENITNEDYRNHGSGQNEAGFNAILGAKVFW